MCDDWMPVVRIPMSIEHFHQLPRHAAFKYEFLNGCALLTPRAKFYHARLVLSRFAPDPDLAGAERLELHPIRDEDFPDLKKVFAPAFHRHQPFASLDGDTLKAAAEQSLERTRTGGDGPWLREASFLVRAKKDNALAGALFITLLPAGDSRDSESYHWEETPPEDLLEKHGGRPHLTWIFVHSGVVEQGAGTTLLGAAVAELTRLGYSELLSTFLVGNHSSMLWHWRCGFELLPNPYSIRRMRRELRNKMKS